MRKDSGTAYLLWALGFCGLCGLHRFYLGQPVPGILYLLTFGICGIGQLIDLFLIPGEVRTANLQGNNGAINSQNIVVHVGNATRESTDNQTTQRITQASRKPKSLDHLVLEECSGPVGISLSQIIIATGEPIENIKKVIGKLSEENLISQEISDSGIILYKTN